MCVCVCVGCVGLLFSAVRLARAPGERASRGARGGGQGLPGHHARAMKCADARQRARVEGGTYHPRAHALAHAGAPCVRASWRNAETPGVPA